MVQQPCQVRYFHNIKNILTVNFLNGFGGISSQVLPRDAAAEIFMFVDTRSKGMILKSIITP
jgi:hypothetical protein